MTLTSSIATDTFASGGDLQAEFNLSTGGADAGLSCDQCFASVCSDCFWTTAVVPTPGENAVVVTIPANAPVGPGTLTLTEFALNLPVTSCSGIATCTAFLKVDQSPLSLEILP